MVIIVIGTVRLSRPLLVLDSAIVAANGMKNNRRKFDSGRINKLMIKATTKNPIAPEIVFSSVPTLNLPNGIFFPKNAAAGSANDIINIGK